ncbi:hypothetical protein ElyMa_003817800 [Elysia marginata]|uniref:Uncharacterized protein n=1 Tax=Elysia marginata TaxID=1093978 RepID=A0AAV4FEZ8_9GAST|nr:hypothetical protein ElyMa_003817800 [Elysia marginata]
MTAAGDLTCPDTDPRSGRTGPQPPGTRTHCAVGWRDGWGVGVVMEVGMGVETRRGRMESTNGVKRLRVRSQHRMKAKKKDTTNSPHLPLLFFAVPQVYTPRRQNTRSMREHEEGDSRQQQHCYPDLDIEQSIELLTTASPGREGSKSGQVCGHNVVVVTQPARRPGAAALRGH